MDAIHAEKLVSRGWIWPAISYVMHNTCVINNVLWHRCYTCVVSVTFSEVCVYVSVMIIREASLCSLSAEPFLFFSGPAMLTHVKPAIRALMLMYVFMATLA